MIVRTRQAVLILKALSRINTALLLITSEQSDESELQQWTDPVGLIQEYEERKAMLKERLQNQLQKFN